MSQLFKSHSQHIPLYLEIHHNMAAKQDRCLFYSNLTWAPFKSWMDVQKYLFVVFKRRRQRIPMTLPKLNYH